MRNSRLTKADSKDERKIESTMDWNETYDNVDVDLCNPHPSVMGMRFGYDSDSLEQNIKDNGQLEPCRAVRSDEDGVHLLVYIGQRRLNAIKSLKSKYEMPCTLKVIIDEDDVQEEELVKRALAENIDENGQRLPLSDLEKVAYCRDLLQKYTGQKTEKILTNAGLEKNTAKKILFLVDKLDNEKVERLHKVESKSNFRFKVAHLDLLLASEDEENFYETASLAAFSQKPPEEIKALRHGARHFCKDIPWFNELFPEFTLEEHNKEIEDSEKGQNGEEPQDGYDSEEEEATRSRLDDNSDGESGNDFGALPEPVIIVPCHYCESINLFKLRTGSPEFIFCNLKDEGLIEQLAVGANAVFDCERECSTCGKTFWITTSFLEGGKLVVGRSASRSLDVPKQEAAIRKVYWNQKEGGWMLYDETSKKKFKFNEANSD
jgi:hypothetical protein